MTALIISDCGAACRVLQCFFWLLKRLSGGKLCKSRHWDQAQKIRVRYVDKRDDAAKAKKRTCCR